jgi:hypothetical protein
MRRLLVLLVLALAATIPTFALADSSPSPATVAACKAEAAQLGNDAFVAKYGPTEPWGHCYAQHAGAVTTTTTTQSTPPPPPNDPATAHTQHHDPPKPNDGQVRSVAQALCLALGKQKGKGGMDACVASMSAKAKTILASCLTTGTSKDALKACLMTAVGTTKRR